jgi:hypothetical protein
MRAPDAGTPQREAEPTTTGEMRGETPTRAAASWAARLIARTGYRCPSGRERGTCRDIFAKIDSAACARIGEIGQPMPASGRNVAACAQAAAGLEAPLRWSTRIENLFTRLF